MAEKKSPKVKVKYIAKDLPDTDILEDSMKKSKLPKLTRWKTLLLLSFLMCSFLVMVIYMIHSSPNDSEIVTNSVVLHGDKIHKGSSESDEEQDEEFNDKIRYKHTKRRLPHALVIGCRKAGTRALLTYLNLHPQVQVAKREVHFFDDDEAYSNGLEWYRKKMPYSFQDQITLEKTPAYFHNFKVPQRVHKVNSSMRFLIIVRDPVERAISDYLQIHTNKLEKNREDPDFEYQAIDQETGLVDTKYPPLIRSMYYQYMWNWLRVFDLEQFMVISGEELVREPQPIMAKVESFLGIEHKITPDMFYYNETRGFYCVATTSDVPIDENGGREKCLAESKGRPHPYVSPEVITKLRQYFAPYNEQFYKMIKRNFGWPTH